MTARTEMEVYPDQLTANHWREGPGQLVSNFHLYFLSLQILMSVEHLKFHPPSYALDPSPCVPGGHVRSMPLYEFGVACIQYLSDFNSCNNIKSLSVLMGSCLCHILCTHLCHIPNQK
jgi:hypothetical protein